MSAAGAASVVGTDLTVEMIEAARSHEEESPEGGGITYVADDAQMLGTFADSTFDGVTCQLGLMDIPDLTATLGAIHRVLRPGGWFVFVIGHPCFLTPHAGRTEDGDGRPAAVVNRYFDETFWRSNNPQGVRRAGNYHRPLSSYLNALVAGGFRIDEVLEPPASGALAEQQPVYSEVPIFFAARVTRL